MKYVLDAKLPDLGPSAVVWQMQPHAISTAAVQRFADVFGLSGTATRTSVGWQVQGTDAILAFVDTDGGVAVSYTSGAPNAVGGSTGSGGYAYPGVAVVKGPIKVAPPLPSPDPTPATAPAPAPITPPALPQPSPPVDVPNPNDATTIARGLLDRLGLLAGQDWSTAVNDSGGVAVVCAAGMPCPTVPPEVSARTVSFSLVLAGTRVDGVDWSVTIGEHRRIESLNGEWASPTTRRLLSIAVAGRRLRRSPTRPGAVRRGRSR